MRQRNGSLDGQQLNETETDPMSSETQWRFRFVWIWIAATLGVATYATLKPSTSASDLSFIPNFIIAWLDANFNFRTCIMAMGVCAVPALLLSPRRFDLFRRRMLIMAWIVMTGLEFAQLWIPTRGFGWADVTYPFVGVAVCEIGAFLYCSLRLRFE